MTEDMGGWERDRGAEDVLKGQAGIEPDIQVYTKRARDGTFLRVMVGTIPRHGKHLSISGSMYVGKYLQAGRYPTWDEIKDARYRFVADECEMVMHLPPKSDYINVHSSCFHLHELLDPKRAERLVEKYEDAVDRLEAEHRELLEAKQRVDELQRQLKGVEAELKLARMSL